MSMLDVAIVPPHLTVLSMRMAVALYVTGISTPEVHPEFPPRRGTLTSTESSSAGFFNRFNMYRLSTVAQQNLRAFIWLRGYGYLPCPVSDA